MCGQFSIQEPEAIGDPSLEAIECARHRQSWKFCMFWEHQSHTVNRSREEMKTTHYSCDARKVAIYVLYQPKNPFIFGSRPKNTISSTGHREVQGDNRVSNLQV